MIVVIVVVNTPPLRTYCFRMLAHNNLLLPGGSEVTRDMTRFCMKNIIHLIWINPADYGQSKHFHLSPEDSCSKGCKPDHLYPYKDLILMRWQAIIVDGDKCVNPACSPERPCLRLTPVTSFRGAFPIAVTLAVSLGCFEKRFNFVTFIKWFQSSENLEDRICTFHNVLPSIDLWNTLHIFLEYLPTDGPVREHCRFGHPPLDPQMVNENCVNVVGQKVLEEMYRNRSTDNSEDMVKLVCADDEVVKVHRQILCAASLVFETMLSTDMLESAKREISFKDFPKDIVEQFVTYMYKGSLIAPMALSVRDWFSLYKMAHRYELNHFQSSTKNYITTLLLSTPYESIDKWLIDIANEVSYGTMCFDRMLYEGLLRILHAAEIYDPIIHRLRREQSVLNDIVSHNLKEMKSNIACEHDDWRHNGSSCDDEFCFE